MADETASAEHRVEAYLDQVLAPLTRRLSALERKELRQELHEHLWGRIDAYRELGHIEADAVTEALRQFGGAEDFLKQWKREWIKPTPQTTLREIGKATRTALLLSLPALLIACLGSPIWSLTITRSQIDWAPIWMHASLLTSVASGWGGFGLDFIFLPLALGVAVGHFAPRHAGIGMLAALAVLVIPADWLSVTQSTLSIGRFGLNLSFQTLICAVYWLPLACTSAALTGWQTQRTRKVPA